MPVSRYGVFFALALLGCAADLVSKAWAFQQLGLPPGRTRWLWEGVAGIQTSLNEGALFGFGHGFVFGFAVLSVAAAGAILWWLFVRGAAHDCTLTLALGAITAGILGNLYDRLGLPGLRWSVTTELHQAGDRIFAVRDWILVMIGDWPWPNFNVADSLLVCGAALLIWHALRQTPEPDASSPSEPSH